ncbi:hypothetical protein [Streptomyces sp. NPDC014006]|uniref:hypothetical protein n=1 Tax=Streptomyces sp. NPDC014006 TaxID=3364870 RepID=UPI0036FC062D
MPEETPAETTTRLRPIPAADDVAKDSGSSARAGSAASASAPSGASGSAAATASSSYLGSPARAGQGVLQQPSHAPGAGLGDTGASAAYRGGRPGPDPFSRPDPGRTGRVPGPSGVPEASGTPFGAAGGGSPDGVTPGGAPGRRPHPAVPAPTPSPDPALSWSTGGPARPRVSFGRPEFFDDRPSTVPARMRRHSVAAAVCLVLGLGLIGGAVTGAWLTGDSDDTGKAGTFTAAAGLWHNVPVDQLFPPSVSGPNAGPGGADRTWTRVAVAPDGGCADAFDPLLRQALAPVGCARLLRATYTDATQSYVTTVGLLFTKADPAGMRALSTRLRTEGLGTRPDLMPRPYAAAGTPAAGFGDRQRAAWTITVLTDAPVVVYAVSGWADGRTVDSPQPAPATTSGATTAPVQAGLGNEAEGLAGRIEKNLRHSATSPTETSS